MLNLKAKTTDFLINTASRDPLFKTMIGDLQKFGFDIRFPLFGHMGEYQPYALESNTPVNEAFIAAFKHAYARGEFRAEFKFSPRFGRAVMAHHWLHELVHFYQDLHGLYLAPLHSPGAPQLDHPSHVAMILLCEAMAATEAIRASWRLQEKGVKQPWRGALRAPDWRALAKSYAQNLRDGLPEDKAAGHLFRDWYAAPVRRYYQKRAEKSYSHATNNLRSLNLNELADQLPAKEKPAYLRDLDIISGHAPNWHDIQNASPVYLWKKYIDD